MKSTAPTAWPFDADRDDPLAELRIPVVASFNPRWKYVAALVRTAPEVDDYLPHSAERTTDAEALMLASFIQEYIQHWFNEGYQRKLAERPLDVDSGCNTSVFIKYGPDDWGYRRVSWIYGPTFVPASPAVRERYPDEHPGPLSLLQVMDREHTIGDVEPMPRWQQWKADHPDTFATTRPATAIEEARTS